MEVHFVVAQENGKSKKFRLTNEEYVVVGRSKSLCQVYISDPVCSSTHSKVSVVNNAIFVEDLNSKNGVYLNGVKIIKQRIYVDDKIRFGNCILFINHSRMDDESIKLSSYHGNMSRKENLTLELEKRQETTSDSIKKLSTMFAPPSRETPRFEGRIELNARHHNYASKAQKKRAFLIDILVAIIFFFIFSLIFKLVHPEAYASEDGKSFFVMMLTKQALTYTVASLIMTIMFHHVHRRLPIGSIGEKITGIN